MTDFDTSVAHPARRYDYWLGGKDNYAGDRLSGDAIANAFPHIRLAVRENRKFLRRTVHAVADLGVKQFLDIGTGLPTAENTHEVAAQVVPDARVVYVDNDPVVLVHSRALLTAEPPAVTAYLEADLRDPARILTAGEVTGTLDLSRPVALLLIAVLHFIPDDTTAYEVVGELVDALAPGSYLVLSHASYDLLDKDIVARLGKLDLGDFRPRTESQVARFFDGLTLLDPGLQQVSHWRRDPDVDDEAPQPEQVSWYGAVARKS
jgi:SAM-dependent methyltransferase